MPYTYQFHRKFLISLAPLGISGTSDFVKYIVIVAAIKVLLVKLAVPGVPTLKRQTG